MCLTAECGDDKIILAKLAKSNKRRRDPVTTVNMFEAKTNLSRYVTSVENGTEPFVVISRGGKPVAKIVPYRNETTGRIGLAEGAVPYLTSLDEFNSIPCEDDFSGNGGLL